MKWNTIYDHYHRDCIIQCFMNDKELYSVFLGSHPKAFTENGGTPNKE